jgi:hypothetical protein
LDDPVQIREIIDCRHPFVLSLLQPRLTVFLVVWTG